MIIFTPSDAAVILVKIANFFGENIHTYESQSGAVRTGVARWYIFQPTKNPDVG
jgi:hypothetical protein